MWKFLLGITTCLLGCGKVLGTPIDAADDDAPRIDAMPDAAVPVPRLYAVTTQQIDFTQVSKNSLEVVDLDTMTLDRHVELGFGGVSSAAISPDGATVYIADFQTGEIRFMDTTTGTTARTVTLAQVRDLTINVAGTKLYAASGNTIVEIDTTTGDQRPSPAVGASGTIALNLGISPDGARVGTSTTNGGSSPTVTLVRTSDMSIESAVPITTTVPNCGASPSAIAFTSNGLLVAWDTNCDELYQVDTGTHTQLAGSIATGRDSGSSAISSNKLTESTASGLVYAIKEDAHLAIMNTQTQTFTQIAGTDTPFASVMLDDGTKLFIAVIHRFADPSKADTLEVIDTATANLTPNVYTFTVATQSVVDMMIARSP